MLILGFNKATMFKVSGNFKQFGEWSVPDPGFKGYIIIEPDSSFTGYMDELYGVVPGMEDLHTVSNLTRFVTGYVINYDGKEGLAFFKLSPNINQAPLVYIVQDLSNGKGIWASIGSYFAKDISIQGDARVKLELFGDPGAAISDKTEAIYSRLSGFNRELVENRPILKETFEYSLTLI